MHIGFGAQHAEFAERAQRWLATHLSGEFEPLRGRCGPGDEAEELMDLRRKWARLLAEHGWLCTSWPVEYGGPGLSLIEQVIWHEEYAKAQGPGHLGHIGETLLGPTLIDHGTPAQQQKFLPPIAAGTALWCQGYSEPEAGSDLAGVRTRAHLEDGQWHITGQKVWTSHALWADWCFVLCLTDADAPKHRGLSYLLVPMDQPGVTVRPIEQMTQTSEFCEVFFENATTDAAHIVGQPGDGWKIALATLAHERGVSTLAQQISFAAELRAIITAANSNGSAKDPRIAERLAQAWVGLKVMRAHSLRTLRSDGKMRPETMVNKLFWSHWHRDLGELAMDVLDADSSRLEQGQISVLQRLFLFSRADTIYAGTSEIQRNIIAQRALNLPRGKR